MDAPVEKQGVTEGQDVVSLQKKVSELESQLLDAQKVIQKHLLEANEVDLLKMRSSDTLTKAKSIIFENTKMIKNQELQIDALNKQVESLRDVVKITKDLLEIRNLEVDQLEAKIHCMEEKHKAEKQRQDLMHQRLEQMIRHNGELKREYEAQLCLFQALRERYSERELAKGVVDTLKADIKVDKEQQQQNEKNQNDSVKIEQKNEEPVTNPTKPEEIEEKPIQNEFETLEAVQLKKKAEQINGLEGNPIEQNACVTDDAKISMSLHNEQNIDTKNNISDAIISSVPTATVVKNEQNIPDNVNVVPQTEENNAGISNDAKDENCKGLSNLNPNSDVIKQ